MALPIYANRRWYDEVSEAAQLVGLLQKFPPAFQTIFAEGMLLMAEQRFGANELMRSIKSLGREKVLALYKSKNKLRVLDQNQSVFNALNQMMVLSTEQCVELARTFVDLLLEVIVYIKLCKNAQQSPSHEVVSHMTDILVARGSYAVAQYVKQLEAEGVVTVYNVGSPPPPGAGLSQPGGEAASKSSSPALRATPAEAQGKQAPRPPQVEIDIVEQKDPEKIRSRQEGMRVWKRD
jgi:hypothetical protein